MGRMSKAHGKDYTKEESIQLTCFTEPLMDGSLVVILTFRMSHEGLVSVDFSYLDLIRQYLGKEITGKLSFESFALWLGTLTSNLSSMTTTEISSKKSDESSTDLILAERIRKIILELKRSSTE